MAPPGTARQGDCHHSFGKKGVLLAGKEAEALYKRTHRARVAILCFSGVVVCLDPRLEDRDVRERVVIDLQTFCLYKAFYQRVSRPGSHWRPDWMLEFEGWIQSLECVGEHDPRCLPLHIFKSRQMKLGQEEGREAFGHYYGKGSVRVDDGEREW